MLTLLQIIKAWNAMGLPVEKLEKALDGVKTLEEAEEILFDVVEHYSNAQLERFYAVIQNGSYKSAFRIMKGE